MIEADGAGFYKGTDFWNWDVETMWAALADHEPSDAHWSLQSSWSATHEMVLTHKSRVEDYRDKLVEAWPPEKNAAAAVYVDRLNRLIASLAETYEAAVANDTALSGAISAIGGRRRELKRVYDQYKANQVRLSEYTVAEREIGGTGAWDAMRPEVLKTQQEHTRLQHEAAKVMVGLSTELREATAKLRTPSPYKSDGNVSDSHQDDAGFGGPISPVALGVDSHGTHSASSTQRARSSPLEAPNHHVGVRPQPGPILDGTGPPHVPPTSTTPGGSNPPGQASGSGPHPGMSPPSGVHGRVTPPAQSPGGGRAPVRGTPEVGALGRGGAGGVIGGGPGVGIPGQPGGAGRPVQRVNPVGGVIGGPMPGNTASMPGGVGPMTGPMGGGRTASERRTDEQQRRWDPDNPWETAEGVDPVLDAPRQRRIDPGPVIGIRR